jgi:hypothetical protein
MADNGAFVVLIADNMLVTNVQTELTNEEFLISSLIMASK